MKNSKGYLKSITSFQLGDLSEELLAKGYIKTTKRVFEFNRKEGKERGFSLCRFWGLIIG